MADNLQHWGVLGMHWGVRRNRVDTSSPEHREVKALRKKKVHELSNAELKKITTRLQLEKQLKDITDAERKAGSMRLKGILGGPLGRMAISFIVKQVTNPDRMWNTDSASAHTTKPTGEVIDAKFKD